MQFAAEMKKLQTTFSEGVEHIYQSIQSIQEIEAINKRSSEEMEKLEKILYNIEMGIWWSHAEIFVMYAEICVM